MSRKVLFVIGGLDLGGQERALSTLANALVECGIHVSIVCLFRTPIAFELKDSIDVVWPRLQRDQVSKYLYALKTFFYLRRSVKARSPDVVMSFGDWYNAFTIAACLGLGNPVHIASRMGPQLDLGRLHELANCLLYRFADSMVVQTERARRILSAKYKLKKITVVPNLVEMAPITRMGQRQKVVISVGRLSREKGHAVLLRAWAMVDAPEWRLQIIGGGREINALQKLADELCIASTVELLGASNDIWTSLSNAEIFCLPSFYEGFPNALVEAMSIPLCCVAANCVAGPGEIISEGQDGFLFPPGDYDKLASVLQRLINDDSLRTTISRTAQGVRGRYGSGRIAEQYMAALDLGA